jgi:enamine deaminase RidA (YjgF/YER057c/UK114 family)
VEALLENSGADWDDMKTLIVYLRDVADAPFVRDILSSELPVGLPYVMVRGAVCRPSWLIEMEGIAVSPLCNSRFKPFC